MRTEAQVDASRLNGAKSHGPVTAEGKAISSQNALNHGLLSSRILLKDENPEAFDAIATELYDEFRPATPFDRSLIDTMANARWREERVGLIERANLDLQIDIEDDKRLEANLQSEALTALAFRTLANETRLLDLISRYEARYERQYLRAHKRLMEIRKTNPKPGPLAPVIAIAQRVLSRAAIQRKKHTTRRRRGRDPFCACYLKDTAKRTQADPEALGAPLPISKPPNEPKPDPTPKPLGIRVHPCSSEANPLRPPTLAPLPSSKPPNEPKPNSDSCSFCASVAIENEPSQSPASPPQEIMVQLSMDSTAAPPGAAVRG